MKKLFLFLFLSAALSAAAQTNVTVGPSGQVVLQKINKNHALVEERQGINVFILSKPQSNYDYLGTIKVGMRVTADPLSTLIKQCKKEFPAADGIIISDPDLQKAKADCIKFKE